MMFKMICILFSIFCLICTTAFAATETIDGITWTYTILSKKAIIESRRSQEISSSQGISNQIVIPHELGGYPVKSIQRGNMIPCYLLTHVTVPNSVTSIGLNAFWGSDHLTVISIPDSVTEIGDNAFARCKRLTDIVVSEQNEAYLSEDGVLFNKDKSILLAYPPAKKDTHYIIPDSVISIREMAFKDCRFLTHVTIPDSVTSIGMGAFWSCGNLKEVTIPSSVKSIGISAFESCVSLKRVILADGIVSIGNSAFGYCTTLSQITIPKSVMYIGDFVFVACKDLTDIFVDKDNVAYSSEDGILFNKKKTRLISYPSMKDQSHYTIPNGVISIEEYAFHFSKRLTSLTLPDSVTSIKSQALSYSGLTDIVIPNGVTSLADRLFRHCHHLERITLPDQLTSIGEYTFDGCSRLSRITIPSQVKSIGKSAFNHCEELTHITLPNRIKDIEDSLFSNCSRLSSVTLPNKINSIGNSAFSNCKSLTTFTIPNSVTSIGNLAFNGCSLLENIIIPHRVREIGVDVFLQCSRLSNISVSTKNRIFASEDGILFDKNKVRLFRYPSAKEGSHYTLPENIITLESSAFEGCHQLTRIVIPPSLISIGQCAFLNCHGLTDVVLSDSTVMTSNTPIIKMDMSNTSNRSRYGSRRSRNRFLNIDDRAFEGCHQLTNITIPMGMMSIQDEVFLNCKSLTHITIPDDIQEIGTSVFKGCSALTHITVNPTHSAYTSIDGVLYDKEVTSLIRYPSAKQGTHYTIPDQVTQISEGAFRGSLHLPHIVLPNQVSKIGEDAFLDCRNMSSITISDPITTIDEDLNTEESRSGRYRSIDGVLYDKTSTTLIRYPQAKRETHYKILDSVVQIDSNAFSDCRNLTEITIPDRVTRIGNYFSPSVFRGCHNLTRIIVDKKNTIYDSVDGILFNKDDSTLMCYPSAKHDTSYSIPNYVMKIGNNAFDGCRLLEEVTMNESVRTIGHAIFEGCDTLRQVTFQGDVPWFSYGNSRLFKDISYPEAYEREWKLFLSSEDYKRAIAFLKDPNY